MRVMKVEVKVTVEGTLCFNNVRDGILRGATPRQVKAYVRKLSKGWDFVQDSEPPAIIELTSYSEEQVPEAGGEPRCPRRSRNRR